MTEDNTDDRQNEQISEITIAGPFGYHRLEGPFKAVKDETVWGIVIPWTADRSSTIDALQGYEGEGAVLSTDGKLVGGGVVTDVQDIIIHDEIHVFVDQYAKRATNGKENTTMIEKNKGGISRAIRQSIASSVDTDDIRDPEYLRRLADEIESE